MNALIYSGITILIALIIGYLSNRITLILNIFFRKLGSEAFLAIDNGERIYPLITAGEIKINENTYYVCYRASILWVLFMPAEFIKKSSSYLSFTGRSAVTALFSASQYYNDQKTSAKKS